MLTSESLFLTLAELIQAKTQYECLTFIIGVYKQMGDHFASITFRCNAKFIYVQFVLKSL